MFKVYKIGNIIEVYEGKPKEKTVEQKELERWKKEEKAKIMLEKFPNLHQIDPEEIDPRLKEENSALSREYYRKQQKIELRRIICNNFTKNSYFSTLTFTEKIYDIKEANKQIKQYVQRLKRAERSGSMKYIFIAEKHEDDSIHYHGLIEGQIGFKECYDLWGGINQQSPIDSVDNVGAYIISYITKTVDKFEGEKHNKLILKSRNLKKVQPIWTDIHPCSEINPVYAKDWEDYKGNLILYQQYNLERKSC